jgi:site-specific recombinase XerD
MFAEFARFLAREAITTPAAVTPDLVRRWIATTTCGRRTLTHKVRLLQRFFAHLVGHGLMDGNPAGFPLPGRTPATSFRPHLLRKEQIAAILEEARRLRAYRRFPLRPQTVHAILVLLYGLGLRLGEACRLRVADVDLTQATLSILQTKFHKERLVPFGPKLGACLVRYIHCRRTIFPPLASDDPLFVASTRRPLSQQAVRQAFHALLETTGVSHGSRGRPRLHDLRHSFAVHRLLRWYREGIDVQSRLPRLSTFMGHIDIRSTQVYLTITPDLLEEANARFYGRFGALLREVRS